MISDSIRKIKPAQLAVSIYLCIMFLIYPLYVRNGYDGIDKAKNDFLWNVSLYGLIIVVILVVLQLIFKMVTPIMRNKPTAVDLMVFAYAFFVYLSMACAVDRHTGLYGQSGWYMGGFLILIFCGMYYVISRLWTGDGYSMYAAYIGSFAVFLLGIINRFDVWTSSFPQHGNGNFISTLGNIGWFNGYLSIFASIGVAAYILKNDLTGIRRILLTVYVFVSLAIALAQGGDSIVMYLAVLFLGMIVLATLSEDGLMRLLEVLMIACAAGQFIHILRMIFPKRFTYDSANMCNTLNNSFLTLYVLIAVAVIYFVLRRISYKPSVRPRRIARFAALLGAVLLIALIIGVIFKANGAANAGAIDFDDSWGNGRGAAIIGGLKMFKSMSFSQKLLGVGPDCFGVYAYTNPVTSLYFGEAFRGAILTNAHNEFVTSLVNLGMLGTVAYYGIFVAFFVRVARCYKRDTRALYIALALAGYLGYNMLNYQQILNYPFAFIVLGMGCNLLWGRSRQ